MHPLFYLVISVCTQCCLSFTLVVSKLPSAIKTTNAGLCDKERQRPVASATRFQQRLQQKRSLGTTVLSVVNARINKSSSSSSIASDASKVPVVIVVGGGVGGLATAARIAAATKENDTAPKVLLLEKNAEVGGRCGSFFHQDKIHGTFRHERGPSLLLLKDVYLDLFRDCHKGEDNDAINIAQSYGLSMKQCIPAYQVVFEDGERIELGFPRNILTGKDKDNDCDVERLRARHLKSQETLNLWEENGAQKWDDYMQITSAYLDCGLPNFIQEQLDLFSFPAFLYQSLKNGAQAWPLRPHANVLNDLFTSTKLKAVASFQDLYVGLEPYKNKQQLFGGVFKSTAPAVFGLLSAIELHPENKYGGVFAPIGGFDAVTKSMEALAKAKGVEIQCNTIVTRIEKEGVYVLETDAVTGDEKEVFLPADLVVCNADLAYAKASLFSTITAEAQPSFGNNNLSSSLEREQKQEQEQQHIFDWDDSLDFGSGVIAFHWSIDKELTDLNTHNVFMIAENQDKAIESWRVLRKPSPDNTSSPSSIEPFNFYVHRASKTDPTCAPNGCDAILVLVPCNTLVRREEYASLSREEAIEKYKQQFDEQFISDAREAVLKRFEALHSLKDVEKHIIYELVDTPGTYASRYNLAAGSPFALSHGFNQLSITRPGAESSPLEKVLYVGASSRPGNGVPLVLIGSKLVAQKAIHRLQNKV